MTANLDLRQVRAIVTDADVLGRLEPAAVAAYLTHHGWIRAHERATGAVWTRRLDDSAVKVFAPTDQAAADFALRMGTLLGALAVAEDRSQLAVLVDLCGSGHGGGAGVGGQTGAAIDVEALTRLLEKATPRPWQTRPDPHRGDETLVVTDVQWGGASYVKVWPPATSPRATCRGRRTPNSLLPPSTLFRPCWTSWRRNAPRRSASTPGPVSCRCWTSTTRPTCSTASPVTRATVSSCSSARWTPSASWSGSAGRAARQPSWPIWCVHLRAAGPAPAPEETKR